MAEVAVTTKTAGSTARLVAKNSLISLIGQVAPLLVAVVTIPLLMRGLGVERFGVLSISWMIIGYFTLFDLGIGRAAVKLSAEHAARGETDLLHATIWTSLAALTGFGILGGLALAISGGLLTDHVLHLPPDLREETLGALYLLACSIPFVLVSAGIRGVIEAHRRFDLTNLVRATAGMAAFAAPLWMLSYTHDLTLIAAALLACRVLELVANALIFRIAVPGLGWPDLPRREQLRRLLDYGGWLTVTNVVGPLMTYLDRFLVGGLLTISAVTYYATPYDVISKQGIVPASLLGVVFPELCVRASGDAAGFIALYEKSLVCLMAIMAVPAIFLVIFAEPLLHGWLGAEFARQSSVVVKLLAIGMFLNGVAQAPFAAIQALGRPDLTAKLHLLELPLYLGLLWLLVLQFGITGAALAWLFRALSDTTLLMWLCHRLQPAEVSRVVMFSIVLVGTGVLLAVLAGLSSVIVTGTVSRFIMFAVCTILIVAVLRLYFAGPVGALTTDGSQPEKVISYV